MEYRGNYGRTDVEYWASLVIALTLGAAWFVYQASRVEPASFQEHQWIYNQILDESLRIYAICFMFLAALTYRAARHRERKKLQS